MSRGLLNMASHALLGAWGTDDVLDGNASANSSFSGRRVASFAGGQARASNIMQGIDGNHIGQRSMADVTGASYADRGMVGGQVMAGRVTFRAGVSIAVADGGCHLGADAGVADGAWVPSLGVGSLYASKGDEGAVTGVAADVRRDVMGWCAMGCMALEAGVGIAVVDGRNHLSTNAAVACGARTATGRNIMQGLDGGPVTHVSMAVGAASVGANIVERCHRGMDGSEISHMTGGADVWIAEPCIQVSMTCCQAARFQGVVASIRCVVTVIAASQVGLGHRIDAGTLMAVGGHTTRCRSNVARGNMVHVLGRSGFVLMAVKAVGGVCAKGNDVGHCGSRLVHRVDISGCVMAGAAVVQVGLQDIRPVAGMVAVGARLAIGLTQVCERVDIYRVVDEATGIAMVMASKVCGVAVLTLSCAVQGSTDARPGGWGMTGLTTIGHVDLARTGKRRCGGAMAAHAVGSLRSGGCIGRNRSCMAMGVGVEVGSMTLGAGATSAAVHRGIATPVDTNPTTAIGRIMT